MQSKAKDRRMRALVLISWSAIHMLSFWCTFLLCSPFPFSAARDSITTGGSISSRNNETLISAGKKFELGFFSRSRSRYIGIWYYGWNSSVVVWVANRDNPLPDEAAGIFSVADDGSFTISDENGTTHFSIYKADRAYFNTTAKLLDSGNLVFIDDVRGILWQSFDHPTDTFLPGMKMDENLTLISWAKQEDPSSGQFTFKRDQGNNNTASIWMEESKKHWRSGESGKFNSYSEMHPGVEDMLTNFSSRRIPRKGKGPSYIPYPNNIAFSFVSDYSYTRVVMSSSGEIQLWNMSSSSGNKNKEWTLIWWAPEDNCSVYNYCGKFGSCNSNNTLPCKCLPGFKPNSPENWGSGYFSDGCSRKSQTMKKSDTFVSLKMMRVGEPDPDFLKDETETGCREACLDNNDCQAYSYVKPSYVQIPPPNTCWLWLSSSDLSNFEEDYGNKNGRDLFVRVAPSDIGSISRSCETCGTNLIPYPLSTVSNCGDPMYFSFNCSTTTTTGQVSFRTPNFTYRVSSINPDRHTFVIQVKDACKNSGGKLLDLSLPFRVNNSCYIHPGTPSFNFSREGSDEVEISWDPPKEPVCASFAECMDWPNSSCKESKDGNKRCLCDKSYHWDGQNLNCTQGVGNPKPIQWSSPKKTTMSATVVVIIIATMIVVSVLCSVISYFFYRRRLVRKRKASRERMQGGQAIRMYDTEKRVKNFIDSAEFKEDDKKEIDVPFFDFGSILDATEYFSEANKLGQGGFGPVYKGKFVGGQEIAVKRLSSHSGQGLEEFKNEVMLIAKLQHRNLVRLLGYCVKGEEKILLYEYMPNKSLDAFIFDRTLCMLLDWKKRFEIILGIARGLLYLHQDSRLRIIHRDLKTGNILLDKEMNPKISDFGLARIVEGKETEANTIRVVGTYGYMSPEYALDGLFSIKSDVFSFGVILLEIVSGKRNTGFYRSQQAYNLLGYAWKLWKEEKALDLMDRALLESCNIDEVMKCIIVGLLCVQEDPSDRPNMSNVLFMLGSESATLPNPKQPVFVEKKWMTTTPSSSSIVETGSNFELTISEEGGR